MFFSKEKLDDMEIRLKYLEIIEMALNWYKITNDKIFLEYSKSFGKLSQELNNFINDDNYSEREERRRRADDFLNFKINKIK